MNPIDNITTPHPGSVPSQPLVWPASNPNIANRVQQTKGSAKPFTANVLPTTQPNASPVSPRTTPQTVNNVRVVTRPAVNGNKQVIVQFNHPGGDAHFAGANIYLKQAGKQATLVGGGAQSPITFTVPTHTAPHTVHVTSFGNWGETPIENSPARHVRLR
jgi:hypothetical protein